MVPAPVDPVRGGTGGRPPSPLDAVYRKSPWARGTSVAGETLILDLRSGRYFSLNPVGAAIWERLDGVRSLAEILADVLSGYIVDESKARSDLLALVERLRAESLIEATAGNTQ